MEVQCIFKDITYYIDEVFYTCQVSMQQIPESIDLKLKGEHENGRTYTDVTAISFESCAMTRVPKGLLINFPCLKFLRIERSNLKAISKADIDEYQDLEIVDFDGNSLEFLPGDLFEGFRNLKKISFISNKLTFIEPTILDGLNDLDLVDFSGNTNYDKIYATDPKLASNATLREIKKEFSDKFYKRFAGVQELTNFKQEKGLSVDINKFLLADNFKDFKIVIGDQQFHVHKFLLAARSPTFAEILKDCYANAKNLKIVDISVKMFEHVLNFLYFDEFPSDNEINFLILFETAGKLKIEELKNFAANKLMDRIDAGNVLEILNISNKYDHDGLRQKAFEEIKKHCPNIEFKDEHAIDSENVAKIIEGFVVKEEIVRKADEDFQKLLE